MKLNLIRLVDKRDGFFFGYKQKIVTYQHLFVTTQTL